MQELSFSFHLRFSYLYLEPVHTLPCSKLLVKGGTTLTSKGPVLETNFRNSLASRKAGRQDGIIYGVKL